MNLIGPKTNRRSEGWKRLRRNPWRVIFGGVILLAAIVVLYAGWTYSAARTVEKMLDRADALDVAGIASGDKIALESARNLIDDSQAVTDSLSTRLGPTRAAAASFGWLPWVGDQLKAPGLLLTRAEAALQSTGPLISAADDLFLLQAMANDGELFVDAGDVALSGLIQSMSAKAVEVSLRMEHVRDAAEDMNELSLIGLLDRRAQRTSSLEKRLLEFGEIVVNAPTALEDARRVVNSGSDLTAAISGSRSDVDLESMADLVSEFAGATQRASVSIGLLEQAVSAGLPGTDLAVFVSDLAQTMNASAELTNGLGPITESLTNSFESLADSEGSLFSNGDELQQVLESLVSQRDSLADAIEQSSAAIAKLSNLISSGRADFLPVEFRDIVVVEIQSILNASQLMLSGPELLLRLVGSGSTQKFLVLGQTSDELRAAGGFTSSVWTLSFEDGNLTETEFIPILRFEDRTLLSQSPPPAVPLTYYMDTGALYLRDVGWDPDFTVVADLATELYRLHQADDVDGVISVTQWGIIRLVDAIGGVDVEGEFITPDDTLELIEQRTDAEGTGFLERLFVGLLGSIQGSTLTRDPFELLAALNSIISEKDVLIFSKNEDTQSLIDELSIGGRFPTSETDRIGIVDSNVGWSKSDRNISRGASYNLDLTDIDKPVAELTLSYRNTGTEIGRNCSSHSPPSRLVATYSVSRNSCYWNYFRAYIATGAEVTEAAHLPLPENSVPDQLDLQEPGSSTFSHEFDQFGDHIAGLVTVPPGDSIKFSFKYTLPRSVVKRTESGFTYVLNLVAQPGARGRTSAVEVRMPEGYAVESTSHEAIGTENDGIRFLFDLNTDQTLRIDAKLDSR